MARPGEVFHGLVEHLERALEGRHEVTIESPKRIRDKVTGRLREHDVVLTYHSSQRDLVVAIECRDHSRPIGSGQVEAFHTKCSHTGVDRGVIVSPQGFTAPARAKAAHCGIDCLTLTEVPDVDWCAQTEFIFRRREIRRMQLNIVAPLSMNGRRGRLFLSIVDGPDEEIDVQVIGDGEEVFRVGRPDKLLNRVIRQAPDSGDELEGTLHIELGNPEAFYFLDDEGSRHPLKLLHVDLDYVVVETSVPLRFYRYGADDGRRVVEALVADAESLGETIGRLIVIGDGQVRPGVQLTQRAALAEGT